MSFSIDDFAAKSSPLTIAVGADHGGFEAKKSLIEQLKKNNLNVIDCGAYSLEKTDDYPDFAAAVAEMVSRGEADAGVLICRSGIGMAIAANRFHGVRAAVCEDVENVTLARQHNCANVVVLSGDHLTDDCRWKLVSAFLTTKFSGESRHERRLTNLEKVTSDGLN